MKLPILLYHSVSDNPREGFQTWTISKRVFSDHMDCLKSDGYSPLTVGEAADWMHNGGAGLPDKPVVITFDDGLQDFYINALPILDRFGFPATVYVTSGYVGGMSDWLEDRMAMLSWEEIRASQQAGIEIGAHSHTHRHLDVIPMHEATDEIHFSKARLEAFLGQPITTFAFPHGYHTARLLQEVREAGYTSGCIVGNTKAAHDSDPFAIPRFTIEGDLPVPELQDFLSGHQVERPGVWRESLRFVWRFARRASVLIRKPARSPLGSSAQDWSMVNE